jgi:AraC family transcriptional regulator
MSTFLTGRRIALTRIVISGGLKAPVEIGRLLERPIVHSIKRTARMNTPFPDDLINAPHENIPASVPRLIDAALAAFDADRDTSRRYLSSASALFGAKREARSAERASQSKIRGGLLLWEMNRLVHYIETHLADKIIAKDLASQIGMSEGRLFRAFKIGVGVTPSQYITARRVERVCTMLITTRAPVAQLALACGFYDQAHLSRLFRRKLGMPPSAWRRAMTVRYAGQGVCSKNGRADTEDRAW